MLKVHDGIGYIVQENRVLLRVGDSVSPRHSPETIGKVVDINEYTVEVQWQTFHGSLNHSRTFLRKVIDATDT
jgi:hypothetical protein